MINRERLLHKTFDIELLGNCDVIVKELCRRLAQSDPSFGEIKHLDHPQALNEVLYENLRPSLPSQAKKKVKLSPSASPLPIHSSKQRGLSSLTSFNPDQSYISHPPRRYVFAGAEISFSSDEDSSSDDENLTVKTSERE